MPQFSGSYKRHRGCPKGKKEVTEDFPQEKINISHGTNHLGSAVMLEKKVGRVTAEVGLETARKLRKLIAKEGRFCSLDAVAQW